MLKRIQGRFSSISNTSLDFFAFYQIKDKDYKEILKGEKNMKIKSKTRKMMTTALMMGLIMGVLSNTGGGVYAAENNETGIEEVIVLNNTDADSNDAELSDGDATVPVGPEDLTKELNDEETLDREAVGIKKPSTASDGISTWDCVWFGNYWQDDTNGDGYCFARNTTVTKKSDGKYYDQYNNQLYNFNGFEKTYYADSKQPIKWRVLDIDPDGSALLLADKAIDICRYNQKDTNITWEMCTLRSYLNSYDASHNTYGRDYSSTGLLKNAFSDEEANAIIVSHIVTNDVIAYSGKTLVGGEDTDDKVFCLSLEEAANPDYGFKETKEERTPAGDFVNSNIKTVGTKFTDNVPGYSIYGIAPNRVAPYYWWLRSPGDNQSTAAMIDNWGSVNKTYGYFDDKYSIFGCIRPAIRLNLSANPMLWSYAGTVSADGTIDDPSVEKPVIGVQLPDVMSVKLGETVTLTPVIKPSGATNKNVTWESSDTSIATVDKDGVVTGVKQGVAYITVTTEDGGFTATCRIDVLTEDGLYLWELSGNLADETEVMVRLACSDSTTYDGRKHVAKSVNGKETRETISLNPDIIIEGFSVSVGGEIIDGIGLKSLTYKNNQYPGEMSVIPVMSYDTGDETIKKLLKDHKDLKNVLNKLVNPSYNKSTQEWSNGTSPVLVSIKQIDITDAPVYTTAELKADKSLTTKDGILVWKGGNVNISWKKYVEGTGQDKMVSFIPLKVTIPGLYYQKVFEVNGAKKVKKIPLRAGGLKFVSRSFYEEGEKITEINVERIKGSCDYAISDELQQLDSKISYIQPELNTDGYSITKEKNSEYVEVMVSNPGYFTGTLPSFAVED